MCNKCGITQKKCSCDNRCAPKCDPCSKQPRIMYCGNNIDCLGVNKGDDLMRVVSKMGSWICEYISLEQSSTNISLTEIEPGETCTHGGVTITITNADTDAVLQEYDLCNAVENPETYLTITETEPTEDCPTGGYSFEVRDYTTNIVEEEYFICKTSSTTYFENDNEVGTATEFNLQDGENTTIQASILGDKITYQVDVTLYEDVTLANARALIANNQVKINRLYRITDKDIFLHGMATNKFSQYGMRRQLILPYTAYAPGFPINNRGVYNKHIHTSANIGDRFVRGSEVWVATVQHSSIVEPTSRTTMGAGFIKDDDVQKEVAWFKVSYSVTNDTIIKQTDYNNNTVINIKGGINMPDSVDECDWALFQHSSAKNNILTRFVNNHLTGYNISNNKLKEFEGNLVTNSVLNNLLETVRNNNLRTLDKNVGGDIVGNTVHFLERNVGFDNITNNMYYQRITSNNSTQISGNKISNSATQVDITAHIRNNNTENITDNTTHIIDNNTVPIIAKNRIKEIRGNFSNEISNNIQETSPLTGQINGNICSGKISNNSNCPLIYRNAVNEVEFNHGCTITGNDGSNSVISKNNMCDINYNRVSFEVYNNTECLILSNANNGGIISNEGTDKSGIFEISSNTNNGGIIKNQKGNTTAAIKENTNNGDIGNLTTFTNRSTIISDTRITK